MNCSTREALIRRGKEEYIDDLDSIKKLEQKYIKYKDERNLITYDDVLMTIVKSKENPNIFKYLIIDEYQDTNNLQIAFINKLNIPNIMAIGDDMQSIYSFRGANAEIILRFGYDFKDAKLIKLDNNYRSTPQIVKFVNEIANSSLYKFDKNLLTTNKSGDNVHINPVYNFDFTKFIMDKISKKPNQTHALIYRTNGEKKYLEPELIKQKIPYSVYGGIKLLDRMHIKDFLAVLLSNMSKSDEISFSRALKVCKGVGDITAQKIILNYPNLENIKKSKSLIEILEIINDENMTLNEILIKTKKWYLEQADTIMKSNYSKEDIIIDFDMIIELANGYENKFNFINDLILDPVHDFHYNNTQQKIILTTIHSSKGLEFDNVYHVHQLQFFKMYSQEELEESRRLFYVAASRAKKELYILDQKEYKRSLEELLLDFSNSGYSNQLFNISEKRFNEFDTLLKAKVESDKSLETISNQIENKVIEENISNKGTKEHKENKILKKIKAILKK